MSETVKLIIEIPEKEYETVKKLKAINIGGRGSGKEITYACLNAVKNGIPLDDVKAEISRKANSGQWSEAVVYGMAKAVAIIDNIGKENKE